MNGLKRNLANRVELLMSKIEILAIHDVNFNGMVVCLKPKIPFIITESLTHQIRHLQDDIANNYYKNDRDGYFYVFWYLHSGRIPWKGIDFNFVYNSLIEHKEIKIESYLTELFDFLFINYIGLGLPIINCSIITRPLQGISQDFFYLNRVNFIKNNSSSADTLYQKIDFCQFKKRLYLPEYLYTTNNYYTYNKFNTSEMQKILDMANKNLINEDNHVKIKEVFDQIKIDVLRDIEEIASKNIKVLERLARKQGTEHKMRCRISASNLPF